MTDAQTNKPLLTVDRQIAHLKSKGVTFDLCSEDEAAEYLSDRTYYYKLAAYRVLFDKRVGGSRDGQYVGLDFGNLRELASLDRKLRYALLPLTLDVEHAARTKLMRIASEREGEDGADTVNAYVGSLNHANRRRRLGELAALSSDAYCGALVDKYDLEAGEMPLWVLLELLSFGSFIDLYLFCAGRWGMDDMLDEHYMLRQAKFVRNACAHSSNVINGFVGAGAAVATNASVSQAVAAAGVSRRARSARMRNPRIKQIVTLLYLHIRLVADGTTGRELARAGLSSFKGAAEGVMADLPNNDAVCSSLGFLAALIDNWFA